VSTFTMRRVFIGVNGTSTKLESSIGHQVEAGQPSHVAGQPGGADSTNYLHGSGRTASNLGQPAKELGRPADP
jgi:hypothetical protein